MRGSRTIRKYTKKSLSVDIDRLFTFGLLLFTVVILALTTNYSGESQQFPLLVAIPLAIGLVAILVLQTFPSLSKPIKQYQSGDIFGLDMSFEDDLDDGSSSDLVSERLLALSMALWILSGLILILIVGFKIGAFVFLLVFYRFRANQTWRQTAIFTLGLWLFVVVLFEGLLGVPLW